MVDELEEDELEEDELDDDLALDVVTELMEEFKASSTIPYDAHKTFFTFSFFCREEHFFGDKFVLTL